MRRHLEVEIIGMGLACPEGPQPEAGRAEVEQRCAYEQLNVDCQ